jgi:hypothetical protein
MVNQKYGTANNAYRNIFLRQDAEVHSLNQNNQVSQTSELLEFQIIVAAQLLNIPANLIGSNINSSHSSLEMLDTQLLRGMNSWIVQLEEEFTSKLISEENQFSRWIEFNRYGAIQMDKISEMQLLKTGVDTGMYSLEFARKILNVPIETNPEETYPPLKEEPVVAEVVEEIEEVDELETEEMEETEERNDPRLEQLIESNLRRFLARIGKSKKPAIEHRSIFDETFSGFNTEGILEDMGMLLDNLNDSKKEASTNIDITQWKNQILNIDQA